MLQLAAATLARKTPPALLACKQVDGGGVSGVTEDWFESALSRMGTIVTSAQLAAFDIYARRLIEENPRAGLTSSRTDREAIYRRHFVESLALLPVIPLEPPLADIGSGGGFPGVPLAILRPELPLTLIEANGKRAAFLRALATELGLANTSVIQARAEDAGRDPGHRERYGTVLARAVAPLRVLLEFTLPLARVGGLVAAPKGSGAMREVGESANALHELRGEIEATVPLELPDQQGPPQTVIIVRKRAPTPDRYPRRPGIPAKRPL
jgi:16S rRNA (guanine527-N7)-methyltransferase